MTETKKRRASWYYHNNPFGNGYVREWVTWAWVSVAILAFLWAVAGGIYTLSIRWERQACRSYSERTLQDAELVNTTFMTWECYVRVDGHWIPRDQIREIGVQP